LFYTLNGRCDPRSHANRTRIAGKAIDDGGHNLVKRHDRNVVYYLQQYVDEDRKRRINTIDARAARPVVSRTCNSIAAPSVRRSGIVMYKSEQYAGERSGRAIS
jgi:hypothetical protein